MKGLTRQQWIVFIAAWLGWGFDVFDGLLFNYVAPNCVPTLLGLEIGSPAAKAATLYWTGLITSMLLLGWAAGGIIFGYIGDRLGRSKTLLLTMLLYALGTGLCAFVPNMELLLLCRFIASLGIGGEWAAGASMVAEAMPEKYRVEAGALLYTSAPIGLFLATAVNVMITGLFPDQPEVSWRYVFLCGLIPAALAFVIRFFLKEPERWQEVAQKTKPPRISELFSAENRRFTRSGVLMALIALLTWWSCNAFIPVVAVGLGHASAEATGIIATQGLLEGWKSWLTSGFNLGGLLGTLLTIPAAKILGRKKMFSLYFALASLALLTAFSGFMPQEKIVWTGLYFVIGLTVFGVFGSFTFYLPELFPTRLRATGSGFCYNIGRVITSVGPFLVGSIAAQKSNALQGALDLLFWVGFIPLIGILLMPLVIETKGQTLRD